MPQMIPLSRQIWDHRLSLFTYLHSQGTVVHLLRFIGPILQKFHMETGKKNTRLGIRSSGPSLTCILTLNSFNESFSHSLKQSNKDLYTSFFTLCLLV
jgi:hypothetical protein